MQQGRPSFLLGEVVAGRPLIIADFAGCEIGARGAVWCAGAPRDAP